MCMWVSALKCLYKGAVEFGEVFEACQAHPKEDFLLQDGYLFKQRLCVPWSGTRELVPRKIHRRSLAGHFRKDKTYIMAEENYH